MSLKPKYLVSAAATAAVFLGAIAAQPAASSAVESQLLVGSRPVTQAAAEDTGETRWPSGRVNILALSAGGRSWFEGPPKGSEPFDSFSKRLPFGTNVDANDPLRDTAAGQSETAVAAAGSTVVAAWNDASAFFVGPSTRRRASGTGLGVSTNGGRTFRDLRGLRNTNPDAQWAGDPTIAKIDPHHFLIGSLYLPSTRVNCVTNTNGRLQLAVELLTVRASGRTSLGRQIVAANGGNICTLFNDDPNDDQPDLAMLDKEWLSYDSTSRQLVMSYTKFFFGVNGQSGAGQIEMVRARLPRDPAALTSRAWSAPIVIWPEDRRRINQGAYVDVAPGGDAYVAWERNVQPFSFAGDPYGYIHVARVRPGDDVPVVGGPRRPRVASLGRNSTPRGGVKSLGAVNIAGYNREFGQDFPRIAINSTLGKVILVWNDASRHPLGDIWLRALPMGLRINGRIHRVNDDSSFALHFLPAVSVRSDGSTSISWYDRRLGGPNSTRTDYFGEVRARPRTNGRDFRLTTGSTNWLNASSLIIPNFGDYTDNASTGNTTYYTWSDGRLGVPQPFVDHHR
jgi:hypothetical protein